MKNGHLLEARTGKKRDSPSSLSLSRLFSGKTIAGFPGGRPVRGLALRHKVPGAVRGESGGGKVIFN